MNPTGGSMMESLGAGEARRVKMIRRPRRAAARLAWFGRGFLAWRTKWEELMYAPWGRDAGTIRRVSPRSQAPAAIWWGTDHAGSDPGCRGRERGR